MNNEFVNYAIIGLEGKSTAITVQDVLQYFGVHQMKGQAGFIAPKTTASLPETAPADKKQLCDERVLRQFWALCGDNLKYIRPKWIAKLAETGLRLPSEWIPSLLHKNSHGIRNLEVKALYGERLRWFIKVSNFQDWEFQKFSSNPTAKFMNSRRQNPDTARSDLMEAWHKLGHVQKQDYVSAMSINLGERDIPFLTHISQLAENKQRKPIIYRATILLTILHADVVQALIQSILDLTHFARLTEHEVPVLDFHWSDIFSGLPIYSENETWQDILKNYGWSLYLEQLIKLVPIDKWCRYWQVSPEKLLEAAYNGKNTHIFFAAWNSRVDDEAHQEFALAMLYFEKNKYFLGVAINSSPLLKALSFEQLQDYVDHQLQTNKETQ